MRHRPFRRALRVFAHVCALGAGVASAGAAFAQFVPQTDPGAYLAARAASDQQDYTAAARYFAEALGRDPDNPLLLDSLLAARIGLGDFSGGASAADRLTTLGVESQLARLTRQVTAVDAQDWATVLTLIDAGEEIGPLVDGLARAWALVGQGQMTEALAAFDQVVEARGLRAFGLYHKALALSVTGDLAAAEEIFALPPTEGMQRTRRSTLAQATVLTQMDRRPDALALLDAVFGDQPEATIADLRARIAAGEPVESMIARDARSGMAEAYLSVAGALDGETADSYTLVYARATLAVRPGDSDAVLLTGALLERLGQLDMAEATYRQIDQTHPAFPTAEMGRADVLQEAGRLEAATEVLQALARAHPQNPDVQVSLGNIMRETDRFADAESAYSAALDLYSEGEQMIWLTHYMRGISRHRQDSWDGAEADFRAALSFRPDQPQVLNYLGYSLVERDEKLDEALSMIESAMTQRPENGAIVDSLGWVLFRLGKYDEAVVHLERAAALEPMESVINDHLGDAYWAVDRQTEARFQWHRALSLDPDETEATRIRAKLAHGLDAVLVQEGAAPLIQVAEDDG